MNPPTDREFGRLEQKVDGLVEQVTGMRDDLASLKTDRAQILGAFQFGGFLKGIAGFVVAAVAYMAGQGKTP